MNLQLLNTPTQHVFYGITEDWRVCIYFVLYNKEGEAIALVYVKNGRPQQAE